jgi:hypothetical protein
LSKFLLERFATGFIGGGNEPSPEVIEAVYKQQKFMHLSGGPGIDIGYWLLTLEALL